MRLVEFLQIPYGHNGLMTDHMQPIRINPEGVVALADPLVASDVAATVIHTRCGSYTVEGAMHRVAAKLEGV